VFAEDRMAVEAEQRAWDEQGRDCNREVFPLILDVRDVLRSNGVAMGPEAGCTGRCLGVSVGEAAVPPGPRMLRQPIGELRELLALPC
jgi:hypothetical protein